MTSDLRPLLLRREVLSRAAIFCAVSVLALVHWGHADRWSRLDRYSITAVLLLGGIGAMRLRVHGALGPVSSKAFFGGRYDPLIHRLRHVFRALDLLTLIDYAQGPLVPQIVSPVLQAIGLALAPLVLIWMWRVDSYLIAHFPATLSGTLLQDGPFRRIRHPRYLGLIACRIAVAAMLSSIIGWIHCVVVTLLFERRMLREEQHLRATYPGEYERYMRRTGRLLPRLIG